MTKVLYNACYGGFSVSDAAVQRYAELKGVKLYPEYDGRFGSLRLATYWTVPPEQRPAELEGEAWARATLEERLANNRFHTEHTIDTRPKCRHDLIWVRVIEELGERANGPHADIKIAEVPSGARYRIDEYDGNESVMMPDDYEWEIAP